LTPFLFFKNRVQTSPFHKKSEAWALSWAVPRAGGIGAEARTIRVRSRAQDLKPMKGRVGQKFFANWEEIKRPIVPAQIS